MRSTTESYIDLGFALITLERLQNLIAIRIGKDCEIGAKEAEVIISNCRHFIASTQTNYLLIHEDYTSSISAEGRTFFQNHSNDFEYASFAIVVKSLSQRMIANFYLRSIQSSYPSKVFSDESEAQIWIKSLSKPED